MYNLNYRKTILQKTAEFYSDDTYRSLYYVPKKWKKKFHTKDGYEGTTCS